MATEIETFVAPPDGVELCPSRGPRIGDDGKPICGLRRYHQERHWANPEDGWGGHMTWSDRCFAGVPNADKVGLRHPNRTDPA